LLGIDLGILFKGFHTDTALTVPVGKIDYPKKELLRITKKSLDEGLNIIEPGIHLGNVCHRIQKIIEGVGYSVIRDLAGHGIGRELQENPSIPNFGREGAGPVLREGMVLAIEPMVSAGDWHVKILKDGWTVATLDGSLSAHFEHTVAVTKDGFEILTKI
jgi:methionyl aminopeptidase